MREEAHKVKQDHRTMGFAKEPVPKPTDFLKAHEKEFKFPETEKTGRINEQIKPKIPDPVKDRPLLGIKTNKNFISQNAVDTIMTVPKRPEKNLVDTRKGDKFSLDPSGLAPIYVKKKVLTKIIRELFEIKIIFYLFVSSKNFGSVPSYIIERKEESAKARAEYEAYMQEYFKKGALRTMSEDEREAILQGLKKNWDELHHTYQSLSCVIDTIPKKMRKEKLENDMKMLEKDIDLLQRHQLVYIAD